MAGITYFHEQEEEYTELTNFTNQIHSSNRSINKVNVVIDLNRKKFEIERLVHSLVRLSDYSLNSPSLVAGYWIHIQ
jgi:predicted GTPase